MQARDPDQDHRPATPLELFFDLTFVVAVAGLAAELHHALAEGHPVTALAGYAAVFFGIWWAWMNFTWFASAYDTDDVPYRLLTLLQMAGVLVFTAGIPAAFADFDFTVVVAGYVVMRTALLLQWLRAAREDPDGRSATLRYAAGIAVVQVAWVARLWLSGGWGGAAFVVLVLAELAVPVWAEFSGRPTTWHPGHIAERYGLFTIIVLGEVVLAVTAAVQSSLAAGGLSAGLLMTAVSGLVLVFALWWSYFKHSAAERLRLSLRSAVVWGYGHYLIFAAVAAVGAGLQVVIDTLDHTGHVSATFAAFTVAVPIAIFLVVLAALARMESTHPVSLVLTTFVAGLVLLTAWATVLMPLPATVALMTLLVVGLLANSLMTAHRTASSADADATSR